MLGPAAFLRDLGRFQTGRGLHPDHGLDQLVERVTFAPVDGAETVSMMCDGDVAIVPAPLEVTVGPLVDMIVGSR